MILLICREGHTGCRIFPEEIVSGWRDYELMYVKHKGLKYVICG